MSFMSFQVEWRVEWENPEERLGFLGRRGCVLLGGVVVWASPNLTEYEDAVHLRKEFAHHLASVL